MGNLLGNLCMIAAVLDIMVIITIPSEWAKRYSSTLKAAIARDRIRQSFCDSRGKQLDALENRLDLHSF